MSRRELETWVDRLGEAAAGFITREGQCETTALLVIGRVPVSVDMPLNGEGDRKTLRSLFELAARGGAEACALVAEAWSDGGSASKLRKALEHRARGGSLSARPDREEVVFVHAISPSGEAKRLYAIDRENEKVRLRRLHAREEPVFNRFLNGLPWRRTS